MMAKVQQLTEVAWEATLYVLYVKKTRQNVEAASLSLSKNRVVSAVFSLGGHAR